MGDDRPLRYVEGDTVVYRASGLGACDGVVLGLAAGRRPNAIPEWLQEIFDEGHLAEPAIVAALEAEYGVDFSSQDEFTLEIGEINDRRVIVRGHVDGWNPAENLLAEAKKFRASTYPKFLSQKVECSPLYPWQTSVYMHAAHQLTGSMPGLLFAGGRWANTNPDPEGEEIMGVTQVEHFVYLDPPVPLKAIIKRIVRWENMIESGMDLTDLTEACNPKMYPCAMFGKGCPDEMREVEEPVEITGEHLARAIEIGVELVKISETTSKADKEIKTLKARKKELEKELLLMQATLPGSPKKMGAGGYVFTHVNSPVAEKVTAGYTLNYFTVKKDTPQ